MLKLYEVKIFFKNIPKYIVHSENLTEIKRMISNIYKIYII